MRAVVLVGGFGTRLRPLTLTTPKQMLPVAGAPMIERVLRHLRVHGVDEVVLSLGYRPDAFTDAYPDASCVGVHLTYAVEPEPLDTAGAIAFAAREAGITHERFVVVNGDVITELDLTTLVARHDQAGAEGTIALTKVDDPSHFGVVPTDPDGRVQAFVEKPPADEAPTDLINAGYYVLEPSVLDRVEPGRPVNIERETFPAMVAEGSLYAWADDAYWIDVGTPERYLTATLDVLGDDHLADEVEIAHDAVVRRSAIGDGSRIEASATVVESVVLPGAVVEAGAVIRRSMVGRGASVGRGAVLDDLTVVGDDVRVDAGARLSGARVPDPDES